MFIFPLTKSSQ